MKELDTMQGRGVRRAGLIAGALVLVLAGTAAGATAITFKVNVSNTASALTTLTGNIGGRVLQLTNDSVSTAANTLSVLGKSPSTAATIIQNSGGGPALDLRVNAGKAPFKVNSTTKVANLNADALDGLDSSVFARRAQEAWRLVGAPGQPAFGHCRIPWTEDGQRWAHYAAEPGWTPVSFYKDTTGRVHIRGLAQCAPYGHQAHSDVIFTLPAGYRPAFAEIRPTFVDGSIPNARIYIRPNGDVEINEPHYGAGVNHVSLDGISFRAER